MDVGGVQKSLYNLLWQIHDRYDVTLCLFSATGQYMDQLPQDIKILEVKGPFRYLGKSQQQWTGVHHLLRGGLALCAKVFGRPGAMCLMQMGERALLQQYDCAISFLHNGNIKNFYGGTQEYVLRKVRAAKKVAYLHGDYGNCGADHPANNRLIGKFDRIAACSDGCARAFYKALPAYADKCQTVSNCHKFEEIRTMAEIDPVGYDDSVTNVVMVSRLGHEKGIERAIYAVDYCVKRGLQVMLHIVGSGNMRAILEEQVAQLALQAHVRFYGEQANPYRYMKNADLFFMTSYHEAAPMVIEEACSLGIPVLTTRTTSSQEMVTDPNYGWVCENSQEAINRALAEVIAEREVYDCVKAGMQTRYMDNSKALAQFEALIEG